MSPRKEDQGPPLWRKSELDIIGHQRHPSSTSFRAGCHPFGCRFFSFCLLVSDIPLTLIMIASSLLLFPSSSPPSLPPLFSLINLPVLLLFSPSVFLSLLFFLFPSSLFILPVFLLFLSASSSSSPPLPSSYPLRCFSCTTLNADRLVAEVRDPGWRAWLQQIRMVPRTSYCGDLFRACSAFRIHPSPFPPTDRHRTSPRRAQ